MIQRVIAGRAGRDIVVDGRHLLIPADAQSAPFRHEQVELHPQNACCARRGYESRVSVRAEFLCDNQLDDQVVLDLEPPRGVEITHWVAAGIDARLEFHRDLASRGVEVRLPAALLLIVANDAGFLVQHPFPLTTDLVRMLRTGGRDHLLVFFNPPHHLAQAPSSLALFTLVHDPAQGHLDRECANGVDDRGEHNAAGKIRWRKDPNGGFVVTGKDRTLDRQRRLECEFLSRRAHCPRGEQVFDAAQRPVAGCGQVTWKQVAEREVVVPAPQMEGLCDEVPVVQLLRASCAVGAVSRDGLFRRDVQREAHVKLVQGHRPRWLGHRDAQAARQQRTARVGRSPIEDQRGRLDDHVQPRGRCALILGARALLGTRGADEAATLLPAVVSVGMDEVLHGEG